MHVSVSLSVSLSLSLSLLLVHLSLSAIGNLYLPCVFVCVARAPFVQPEKKNKNRKRLRMRCATNGCQTVQATQNPSSDSSIDSSDLLSLHCTVSSAAFDLSNFVYIL